MSAADQPGQGLRDSAERQRQAEYSRRGVLPGSPSGAGDTSCACASRGEDTLSFARSDVGPSCGSFRCLQQVWHVLALDKPYSCKFLRILDLDVLPPHCMVSNVTHTFGCIILKVQFIKNLCAGKDEQYSKQNFQRVQRALDSAKGK